MEKQQILVVDDDREIVNAIAINLQNEGYEVLTAYDGLQALGSIALRRYLIILDVMMPIDGLSTTLKVREENIPIIILSAVRGHGQNPGAIDGRR